MTTLELKVPPLAVVLLVAALMWLVSMATPALIWRSLPTTVPALIFAVAGGLIALLGVLAFARSGTTVNPLQPAAASRLVRAGIYRLSRNPMYLGFLLALTGWALFLGNPLSFVVLPAFVIYLNRFQIVPEEQALAAKFGDEFIAYMQRVRRWI